MKTPESWEKQEICKYLDSIEAWYFKPYMAGFGKSGVADIIACIDGRFWSLEIKREGKSPTKIQTLRMNEIRIKGGKAAWGTAAKIIPEIKTWLVERDMERTRKILGA